MKFKFWYLAAGLEVWLGVFGILLGLYTLMSIVGLGTQPPSSGIETFAGIVLIAVGAGLVGDAIRRELLVRAIKQMEASSNPLDSPTQA